MLNMSTITMEVIIFLSYVLICAALFKRRFSQRMTAIAFSVTGLVIAGMQTVILLSGEATLMATLMPLTAYLPFTVMLFFLSDGGLFENAAICSVGMLEVLVLESMNKIFLLLCNYTKVPTLQFIFDIAVAIMATTLVFVAFRWISKAFRLCISEKERRNDLLLFVPVILILLMLSYFLNSTTNILILIFTMIIALSIFFIIARLLNMTAKLISAKRSEKELSEYIDIQRRGYDKVVRKMEATRAYRHDMRHHLAVIEGLAKQKEDDKIIEYVSNLNGSFGKFENVTYCKNSELNALLSEYISRAENAGCKVTQSFILPEKLPFEESDVCIVLANAIENAVNACVELPQEERYIKVSAEYMDGHRLLVSVENPCSHKVKFDANGLPVIDNASNNSDEHGIGLRSIKHVTEKYNGFLSCMLENGEYVFRAVLFYDNSSSLHKDKGIKSANSFKHAATALLGLGLGMVIVLNTVPPVAEAASELLSINIRTIKNFAFGWGSNLMDIQEPEFEGNSVEELNSAVKNYVDEAKEKFWWYFNRRYQGYVGEDMKYTVIRDDEKYFIVEFKVTVNVGGSMDYGRWINYDKSAGKVLELADMFKEDSDYIGVISAEILKQMKEENEEYNSQFYVDGTDAFTEITPDVNFYIDNFDRIVIVFDEYEVAPGSMGSPEFFIPNKILKEIAR